MSDNCDLDLEAAAALGSPAGRMVIATIGIDRYRDWPSLGNAVGDAQGVRSLFQRLGFEEVTAPLLDEQATGHAIHALVTDGLTCLGPSDSLVLFYAGHGGTRIQCVGSQQIETGYLIPSDAVSSHNEVATWIELTGWLRHVSRLPAKHILVILDACHSGIALDPVFKWRDIDVCAGRETPLATLSARRSRRIITSALGDQVASDSGPVPGHSLFTGSLIEGLCHGIARDGRAAVTGSELWLYVRQRVMTYPRSRQTPDFGALDLDERGEILLPFPAGEGAPAGPSPFAAPVPRPALPAPVQTPRPLPPGAGPAPAPARDLDITKLSEVREVLVSAFSKAELDRFLFDHFDYDRDAEVGSSRGGLRSIIDLVLRDFARQGRFELLLSKIAAARPARADLQDLYWKYVARRASPDLPPARGGPPCS